MKQLFTLITIILIITGCEKPKKYKCVCTSTSIMGAEYDSSYTIHATRHEAKKGCRSSDTRNRVTFDSRTCSLTE